MTLHSLSLVTLHNWCHQVYLLDLLDFVNHSFCHFHLAPAVIGFKYSNLGFINCFITSLPMLAKCGHHFVPFSPGNWVVEFEPSTLGSLVPCYNNYATLLAICGNHFELVLTIEIFPPVTSLEHIQHL